VGGGVRGLGVGGGEINPSAPFFLIDIWFQELESTARVLESDGKICLH
jgi:hypothetical protein